MQLKLGMRIADGRPIKEDTTACSGAWAVPIDALFEPVLIVVRRPRNARTAKLRRTIRSSAVGVKTQFGSENGERLVEVGLEILHVFDPHRNPYETVG